jgi:hypothetical protein
MSTRLGGLIRLGVLVLAVGACTQSEKKVQVKETRADAPDRRPAATADAPAPPTPAEELVDPLRADTIRRN